MACPLHRAAGMARALDDLHLYSDPRLHDRVREHSAQAVNERIDRLTHVVFQETVAAGHDAIVRRIQELDREWDIDRALIANFAAVGGLTFWLGRAKDKRWSYLFGAQQLFLLMHALIGWCPPVALFRRLGFRTAKEIAAERQALVRRLQGSR